MSGKYGMEFFERFNDTAGEVIKTVVIAGGAMLLAAIAAFFGNTFGVSPFLIFAVGTIVFLAGALTIKWRLQDAKREREFQQFFIFRHSPLFTRRRRKRIRNQLLKFRNRLQDLRLTVPVNALPIGVGHHGTHFGVDHVGPFTDHIELSSERLDDPFEAVEAYSEFVVGRFLTPVRTVTVPIDYSQFRTAEFLARQICAGDIAQYLAWSFMDRVKTYPRRWIGAFWQMRNTFGTKFTDDLVVHMIKSFEQGHSIRRYAERQHEGTIVEPQCTDPVIYWHLEQAVRFVDNKTENLSAICEILKSYGIALPEYILQIRSS